jgi:uncharacterized protein YpuA (DUF1002 family)
MRPKRSRSRLAHSKPSNAGASISRKRQRGSSSKSAPIMKSAKEKMGNKISDEKLHQLAQGVRPEDMHNEQKMRELIHQISKAFNVPVDDQTVRELTKTLKTSDFNQIGAMLGNMLKK